MTRHIADDEWCASYHDDIIAFWSAESLRLTVSLSLSVLKTLKDVKSLTLIYTSLSLNVDSFILLFEYSSYLSSL